MTRIPDEWLPEVSLETLQNPAYRLSCRFFFYTNAFIEKQRKLEEQTTEIQITEMKCSIEN